MASSTAAKRQRRVESTVCRSLKIAYRAVGKFAVDNLAREIEAVTYRIEPVGKRVLIVKCSPLCALAATDDEKGTPLLLVEPRGVGFDGVVLVTRKLGGRMIHVCTVVASTGTRSGDIIYVAKDGEFGPKLRGGV